MINPTPIYIDGSKDRFVKFSGYVKSVTPEPTFSYVGLKSNTEAESPLVFVKCFANPYGVNHKKLVANSKGRFIVILAERVMYNGKDYYNAKDITLGPREFAEKTHPVIDDTPLDTDNAEVNTDESEAEYKQLSLFDYMDADTDKIPF